jgi:hypothetical protein
MSLLKEILEIKTEEFKNKSYDELSVFVNKTGYFKIIHMGKSFVLEIHAYKNDDELRIMIECSRSIFSIGHFGRAKYFSINKSGEVKNIEGF